MDISEKNIEFNDIDLIELIGPNDKHLKQIERKFTAEITMRGDNIRLKGPAEELQTIEKIFTELIYILKRNKKLRESDVRTVLELSELTMSKEKKGENQSNIVFYGTHDVIKAKSDHQKEYLRKVEQSDLVFSIGPAGTGKTFLAVAMALKALQNNDVSRIIITRPAVEAGESLGFLPGDLKDKIDPYVRPLTDALKYMLSPEKVKTLLEREIIEISPLAYMRGRTLNNSFIILDEAQNSTQAQMKMFLTRLGKYSRAVITGDITQIDLQKKSDSGLIHATKILKGIKGIDFVYFDSKDVVRHRLVAEIINAYETNSNKS